jgi:hypothetical protein
LDQGQTGKIGFLAMEFGIKGDAIMRLQTIEQFVEGSIIGDPFTVHLVKTHLG